MKNNCNKIAVIGCGYVGLSLSVLLSTKNEVVALDVCLSKVDKINKRINYINDDYIDNYFRNNKLNLKATLNYDEAIIRAKYAIVCVPTNYNNKTNSLDTSIVEKTIERVLEINDKVIIIIKSTIPVGFTDRMRKKYKYENIIFSPEFLREGSALYDCLHPSRIIIGQISEEASAFAQLLLNCTLKKDVEVKYMDSTEAECVKLFSNTYLALRVAYFNELDSFCEVNNLNTKDIIEGVCLDERIGNYYNNPSFGYGGYCLPKDVKQIQHYFSNINGNVIKSITKSNESRKKHISNIILKLKPKVVGIYRLTTKNNSDNFRQAAIIDIMKYLSKEKIEILIYEPLLENNTFNGYKVEKDIEKFKKESDVIIANRKTRNLDDVSKKVYSRDIFYKD